MRFELLFFGFFASIHCVGYSGLVNKDEILVGVQSNGYRLLSPKVAREKQNTGTHTSQGFYFTTSANRKQVYEQEYLVVTYSYHSQDGIDVKTIIPQATPTFTGFLCKEIIGQEATQEETKSSDGEYISTGIVSQYILSPQKSGILTIPGITFDCELTQRVSDPNSLDDFFGGSTIVNVSGQGRSQDVTIKVLPLPQPLPPDYSGGVGKFSVTSCIANSAPKTGEIDTLRIIIHGVGNHHMIKAPSIAFPTDFDTFDAKVQDKTHLTPNGSMGDLELEYTFIPLNAGTYTIPGITFTFFDTASKNYVTILTEMAIIDVKSTAAVRNSDTQLRDIHIGPFDDNDDVWKTITRQGSIGYYAAMLSILIMGIGCVYQVRRYKQKYSNPKIIRQKRAKRIALIQLRDLQRRTTKKSSIEYYSLLLNIFREYIAAKFLTTANGLSNRDIIRMLQDANIKEQLQHSTKSILDAIDFIQYSKTGNAHHNANFVDDIICLIVDLEEAISAQNDGQ